MDGAGLLGGGDDGSTKPSTSTGSGAPVARISADAAGPDDEAMQRQALETHGSSFLPSVFQLVELSENLVRLRTGADGGRICPASLVARVPGKLTLDRLM